MTTDEKLAMVKTLLEVSGEAEDARIKVYLTAAEKEIISWRYSLSSQKVTAVPEEYEMTQVFAVVAGYSQSGAENQLAHTENGITRQFKYADMIAYIRSHVLPIVGCL